MAGDLRSPLATGCQHHWRASVVLAAVLLPSPVESTGCFGSAALPESAAALLLLGRGGCTFRAVPVGQYSDPGILTQCQPSQSLCMPTLALVVFHTNGLWLVELPAVACCGSCCAPCARSPGLGPTSLPSCRSVCVGRGVGYGFLTTPPVAFKAGLLERRQPPAISLSASRL